ncbi:2-oxo-4-hydroxy-4-carboxy-5-ureidoimidazoline decarboxylase [Bacillus sp. B1-b2]|uniref:2-oxo-4-hydroxy-4-carboxy-5-ureidoimidazoline decarboxylase n=1 Tax=Bacillus sp. B1-b2 TaxID=2653201 RepID=UPI00126201B2|nr:2-oxo-4-hydroxy-4-carboxy-5-ureidoimidazoline decarboxylase [Bacillus sp. B1-b2]KAB7671159.1 2-oxo-4-hydroxy-4-carboxy-5-ureidoimidazoline decarboxylase [Bacillus sp. B1-b2]
MYHLSDVNQMSREEFMEKIGWVFEHSPWISSLAWKYRPFSDRNILHQMMVQVVEDATKSDQMNLIRAHPDLGSRLQMTDSSVREQKGAGLNTLSEEEYQQFVSLNKEYISKFQFPFILAVKGHTKDSIYKEMQNRYHHSEAEEFETALKQIYIITKFRLEDIILSDEE